MLPFYFQVIKMIFCVIAARERVVHKTYIIKHGNHWWINWKTCLQTLSKRNQFKSAFSIWQRELCSVGEFPSPLKHSYIHYSFKCVGQSVVKPLDITDTLSFVFTQHMFLGYWGWNSFNFISKFSFKFYITGLLRTCLIKVRHWFVSHYLLISYTFSI